MGNKQRSLFKVEELSSNPVKRRRSNTRLIGIYDRGETRDAD